MGLSSQGSQKKYCEEVRGYDIVVSIDMRFRDVLAEANVPYKKATEEYRAGVGQIIYGITSKIEALLKSDCVIFEGAIPQPVLGGVPRLPQPPASWERCKKVPNIEEGKLPDVKSVSYTHLTLPTICSV